MNVENKQFEKIGFINKCIIDDLIESKFKICEQSDCKLL